MTSMRIAITADPYLPVPPTEYGGIERVVDFVVRGLTERGHHVTLMAHPNSHTSGTLIGYGVPPHYGPRQRAQELWQVGSNLWRLRDELDVVLSWGRLAAMLPIMIHRRLPKIQRYCRDLVPWRGVRAAVALGGESIRFAGASGSVYRELPTHGPAGGRWDTVFDGVESAKYECVSYVAADAPLVFLGRLERIKGAHSAIEIARKADRDLVIAGNRVNDEEGRHYFESEIAPHVDGRRVKYIGAVNDVEKNVLLGSARALLMPIEWQEAFGIVMAEAFACGTPVVGFDRGSIPEIVRHGVNGFICRTTDEAASLVDAAGLLNRVAIRRDCEARFDAKVIVDRYEQLMAEMVARSA